MRAVETTGSQGLWQEVFRARRTVHSGEQHRGERVTWF
jgi:hypothetical protein